MNPFEFGEKFRIEVSGSSHGPSVGVRIGGCPAGIEVNESDIQLQLDHRKPGQSLLTTQRVEEDKVVIESGIENGATTGGEISMHVKNKNVIAAHYSSMQNTPRPGHADFPAKVKYGPTDLSGGGFFSGRMTAAFVMAGAVAKKIIGKSGIETMAFARQIGSVSVQRDVSESEIRQNTYSNPVHTAAAESVEKMVTEVESARRDGDSVGGVIECRILGVPAGRGEPMFRSIESVVSQAMFAIPAVKGMEFGSGFAGSTLRGSQNNDGYALEDGKVVTTTNNCGGILGGLSTGMPIIFRVAIKPTSSIYTPQHTVDLQTMKPAMLSIKGRHDPCIAIRAVPVVENLAAVCIADMMLLEDEGKKRLGERNGNEDRERMQEKWEKRADERNWKGA
ncbi:chorismate synthase [Candidatus Micrarchaeota archaeon]|nr:chorismate synthase [Candidatus Micrarchaeota archaeon]